LACPFVMPQMSLRYIGYRPVNLFSSMTWVK
jgi:hypothetical protein